MRGFSIASGAVLVFCFLSLDLFASTNPSPSPLPISKKILITYFEPFGGASINSSEEIAKKIQASPGIGAEIVLCKLPVVYDLAGEVSKKCLKRIEPKPEYVLSLGEADCTLRFETAAHNRDATPGFADNVGNIRDHRKIEPQGPTSDFLTFPVEEWLCDSSLTSQERSLVEMSATPGGFVCNNLAFSLSRYFKRESPSTRYGFVHVPSHKCAKPELNTRSVSILVKFLQSALKSQSQTVAKAGLLGKEVCRKTYLDEIQVKQLEFSKLENKKAR